MLSFISLFFVVGGKKSRSSFVSCRRDHYLLSSFHLGAILYKLRNVKIEHMYHDSSDWKCDPNKEIKNCIRIIKKEKSYLSFVECISTRRMGHAILC